MKAPNSDTLYAEGDYLLESANLEMQRSEEDVVAHMVCFHARQSIANYLRGFLVYHGQIPETSLSLDSLRKQCLKIDKKFGQLDLSPIHCRHETDHENFCLEVKQVDECLRIAKKARQLVRGLEI